MSFEAIPGDLSSGSSSDNEDHDEPSQQVEKVLSNFRNEWQEELKNAAKSRVGAPAQGDQDSESRARFLFSRGVELEKSGKLYEAIQFYRRAVQLVPDIEFRVDKPKIIARTLDNGSNIPEATESLVQDPPETTEDADSSSEDECVSDLVDHFQRKLTKLPTICQPSYPQKGAHISVLPTEMLLYILRWVVSSDLDLRSLEMFSMVCRGFYVCARTPELWRATCARIWGDNTLGLPPRWPSWRHMFIDRARVCFNGCYIGKTTYIRAGENSFQDQFYRPWHLVTYNRYIRFFPEGVATVLTSADDPAQCVSVLKSRNAKNVLKGFYWLKDDYVTVMVQRQDRVYGVKTVRQRSRPVMQEPAEQTFRMELEIKPARNKRHAQLVWKRYSVYTKTGRGDETTNDFDVVRNRFPPFLFSRVRSYTSESEMPLM